VQAALTQNVGGSVIAGHSVLIVHDVVDLKECATLLGAGRRIPRNATTVHCCKPGSGRIRQPIKENFSYAEQNLCDTLLMRTLAFLSGEESLGLNISQACFGDEPFETVTNNPLLSFATGEPAVNIYTAGGDFAPHQDKQSLTILVALSAPQAFEGGGTAFFQHLPKLDPKVGERNSKPAFVLTPPPGSVILFGGTVLHAACPVVSGERGVFVASVSLASGNGFFSQAEDAEGASTHATAATTMP